jgi:hypothetical protein
MDLEGILKELQRAGLVVRKTGGRFREEVLLEVLKGDRPLLKVLLFPGRSYYRGWLEVFDISPAVDREPFFGSELEDRILGILCKRTDRIFVEYVGDRETVRDLSLGVPPPLSRLGFLIARRGFTWFKDWYFPEGLREGNPKIQAERPADPRRRDRHLELLRRDLGRFLLTCEDPKLRERVEERFKILQRLWRGTSS